MHIVWITLAAVAGALGAIGLNYVIFGRTRRTKASSSKDKK